jgi:hypothetical protein
MRAIYCVCNAMRWMDEATFCLQREKMKQKLTGVPNKAATIPSKTTASTDQAAHPTTSSSSQSQQEAPPVPQTQARHQVRA